MTIDYILNGRAHGNVAAQLMGAGLDTGILRPFLGRNGKSYVTLNERNKKGELVANTRLLPNAQATLTQDEWIAIDTATARASGPRLRAWNDLRAANSYTIPQGMGKTVLESSMAGDITPAEINMDGLARADQDIPLKDITGVPLPIIHKDAQLSFRQVLVSRNGNMPLDTTYITLATRKVAEEIEKLTLGVGVAYSFAGYALYGYTNYPGRQTVELTDPTDVGWTPKTLVTEIVTMVTSAYDAGFYGPFRIYMGSGWSLYMGGDYNDNYGGITLQQRIMQLEGIQSIQTVDYLPSMDIILVQMTEDVARAIIGMDIVTLQWEQQGGMELRLKVMAIMVPQIRGDFYGNCGLVHGTVVEGGS